MKLDKFITNNPNIRVLTGPGKPYYWTCEVISWLDIDGNQHDIHKGFVFDGYSVPQVARSFLRGLGSIKEAAAHDFGYLTQELTRKNTDFNLKRGIYLATHRRWTSLKAYHACRLAAWVAWDKHKDDVERYGYETIVASRLAETLDEALEIVICLDKGEVHI